ncbi:hypothetical protein GCM10023082_10330 [Streptomyces tremellae]|uniref:Uncharacterized protein n=1 Tax=Streptomyces tremellae TaxID=1124239 RepID=A0ABP7E6P8_9ACTN
MRHLADHLRPGAKTRPLGQPQRALPDLHAPTLPSPSAPAGPFRRVRRVSRAVVPWRRERSGGGVLGAGTPRRPVRTRFLCPLLRSFRTPVDQAEVTASAGMWPQEALTHGDPLDYMIPPVPVVTGDAPDLCERAFMTWRPRPAGRAVYGKAREGARP